MKINVILIAIIAIFCLISGILFENLKEKKAENIRLTNNQVALLQQSENYKTKIGENANSLQILELKKSEFEQLFKAEAQKVESLGIKLKRLESFAQVSTQLNANVTTPIHDSIIITNKHVDTLRCIDYSDKWISLSGCFGSDTFTGKIQSVDTMIQVLHRIPRHFLFIKYGTKAINQEIILKNPYNYIKYSSYIRVVK